MILKSILKLFIATVLLLASNDGQVLAQNKKQVICYHGTWSTYRKSLGKFDISNIDPFLCTHLMYAFFGIEEDGSLRIIDPYLDLEDNGGRGNIRKFNALKLQNPTLKTFAAVGGWNEGSHNFSIVANDSMKRKRFVRDVVRFIQRHGFDGLDLDWEYPNQRHNLTNDDKNNFITLLRELREGLDPYGYMLTAAVGSAEFSAALSYNIPEIVKYLDLINVMSYDLHGPWEKTIGFNAPLYAGPNDESDHDKQLNVAAIIKYWVDQGAPRDKLILGVPFYGRSFTLESIDQHKPGSPHLGRGLAGHYSIEPGAIGYNELCEKFRNEKWSIKWEEHQKVPYAFKDRHWISFETAMSIKIKAEYVMEQDLAGMMVWSIESDDFLGNCDHEQYPLLKQINRVLYGTPTALGLTGTQTVESAAATNTFDSTNSDVELSNNNATYTCQIRNAFARDPENCAKFYYCDQNQHAHNFVCPPNLYFDLNSNSCNYAAQVDC